MTRESVAHTDRGDRNDLAPVIAARSRHRDLALRIRSYIVARLHDPDLTPGAVAAAHHISVSHLHRLFQPYGVTVSTWIRRQRLEGACRDLADPTLRAVRVHRIAARWGFTHHAAFTRAFGTAFGTAFGIAPSEYRLANRAG